MVTFSEEQFSSFVEFDKNLAESICEEDKFIIVPWITRITETFNTNTDWGNDRETPLPIGTVIAVTAYNTEFDSMDGYVVLDSEVLRNTAKYYNALADEMDRLGNPDCSK